MRLSINSPRIQWLRKDEALASGQLDYVVDYWYDPKQLGVAATLTQRLEQRVTLMVSDTAHGLARCCLRTSYGVSQPIADAEFVDPVKCHYAMIRKLSTPGQSLYITALRGTAGVAIPDQIQKSCHVR